MEAEAEEQKQHLMPQTQQKKPFAVLTNFQNEEISLDRKTYPVELDVETQKIKIIV